MVDRRWPELQALADQGMATLHETPAVHALPVTPAVVASIAHDATPNTAPVIRYGVPDIIALLDTLHTPRNRP
jgi:hypothetical protein